MENKMSKELEKEFDKKFGYVEVGGGLGKENLTSEDIKNFITQNFISRKEVERLINEEKEKWKKCVKKSCKNKVECERANHYVETIWEPIWKDLQEKIMK